jgi:hypothetical protein
MTDNFKLIKEFIQSQWGGQFNEFKDAFYSIEIIGRKKDNTTVEAHKFKTYYIKNMEDFDKYENEIKLLCDILQMRAYISVNAKSLRKVTLNTMAEYANRIAQDNFAKPYSVFDSCAAKYVERADQLWIIDVDKEDADHYNMSIDDLTIYYGTIIEEECEPKKPVVEVIPTRSGAHIITHPFNTVKFANKACRCKTVESLIKKNNNTLLYENNSLR